MEKQIIQIQEGKQQILAIAHIDGTYTKLGDAAKLKAMVSPVHCNHCGKNYDLAEAKVVHRYADCTQYKTPCCKKLADDREWKSLPDFSRLTL